MSTSIHSTTTTTLTTQLLDEIQSSMGSFGLGAARIGAWVRYFLSDSRASSASLSQTKLSDFRKSQYRGIAFSPSRMINRLRAATHPVIRWTPLIDAGFWRVMIALIFSGFASMPLSDTMYPRSLPAGTPKVYLAGFSFIWYVRRFLKVSC